MIGYLPRGVRAKMWETGQAMARRISAVVMMVAAGAVVAACNSGEEDANALEALAASASTPDGSKCDGRDMLIDRDRDGETVILEGECGTVVVQANGVQVEIEAARTVVLDGQGIAVTVGQAQEVTLSGRTGRATIDSVGALTVNGNGMTIDAREADSVNLAGGGNMLSFDQVPVVTVSGNDNSLHTGAARTVEVNGSHNTIVWTGAALESVKDTGAENTLTGQR